MKKAGAAGKLRRPEAAKCMNQKYFSTLEDDIHPFSGQAPEAVALPRRKREIAFTHYSKVLFMILNYLGFPESTFEFIQAVIIAAGFPEDPEAEIKLCDAEIAAAVAFLVDDQSRVVERFRKQRQRLADWQTTKNEDGLLNPVVMGIESHFDVESKKRFYTYQPVICGLVRQVIEKAPLNSKKTRITAAAREVASLFIKETKARPPVSRPKRVHSPESNLKRGLTVLEDGFETETRLHGEDSARNLLRKVILESGKNDTFLNPILQIIKEIAEESTGIFPIGLDLEKPPELIPGEEAPPAKINPYREQEEYEEKWELPAPPRSSLPSSEAVDAVRLFESVGVTEFGETTVIEDRKHYEIVSLEAMRQEVDQRIEAAESWGSSYIVRPVMPAEGAVKLIQIDDFSQEKRAELEALAFIGYKTSENKEQAYIAVRLQDPRNETERLRVRRSLIQYFGADKNATGAGRFPGSRNTKYRPAFPVSLTFSRPGRIVQYSEIVHLLLPPAAPVQPRFYKPSSHRPFPSWELEEAAIGGNDWTRFDWHWALKALDRERGIEETIEELLRVSAKAKKKGRPYAESTVKNAARAMGIL